jgi:hypothetical protein
MSEVRPKGGMIQDTCSLHISKDRHSLLAIFVVVTHA